MYRSESCNGIALRLFFRPRCAPLWADWAGRPQGLPVAIPGSPTPPSAAHLVWRRSRRFVPTNWSIASCNSKPPKSVDVPPLVKSHPDRPQASPAAWTTWRIPPRHALNPCRQPLQRTVSAWHALPVDACRGHLSRPRLAGLVSFARNPIYDDLNAKPR